MLKGLLFLLKQVWIYKKVYVLYEFFFQISKLMTPISVIVFPKYIIDELMGKQRLEYIFFYIFLMLSLNLFGGVLTIFFEGRIFEARGIVFNKFQYDLAEKLLDCDYEKIEDSDFLDIKERAGKFLYANGMGFGMVLDSAFNIMGNLFVFVSIAAIISTLAVSVVCIFIILVLLSAFVDYRVRKNYTKWDMEKVPIERKTSYMLNVIEDFSYGKDIRIYRAKNFLLKKLSMTLNESNRFYGNQIRVLNKSKYFNVFMALIKDGISYSYLVYNVIANMITIGDFTMYVSAVSQFSNAMNDLMQSILDIRQFGGYYDALEKYLNIPTTMREGVGKKDLEHDNLCIEFHDVSFRYPGQKKFSLQHINLKIEPKEKLAIIGENGAGKTTFVKLLMRLYDPTDGYITVNGVNIKDLDYDYYQSLLAVVFQDYKLFSFSVKENIDFSDNPDDTIIERELAQIGMMDKIETLSNGINTNIHRNFEPDGFEPSGGEGQKIAIVRALHKRAPIIILDEPTSALDPRAEYNIYQDFNRLSQGKTALYISHRMSSAKMCDKIVVLKKGMICEYGTHTELLQKNGLYTELYHLQAKYYIQEEGKNEMVEL